MPRTSSAHGATRARARRPRAAPRCSTRRRAARCGVARPRRAAAARSSGASTSSARPGSVEDARGRGRGARAAARWFSNDGSPNVSGIASGGAERHAVGAEPRARGGEDDGGRGVARAADERVDLVGGHAGHVAGIVGEDARRPPRRRSACAAATAAVWPRFSASVDDLGAEARARCADGLGSRVTTHTRVEVARPRGRQHVPQHRARELARARPASSTRMSRCLALRGP